MNVIIRCDGIKDQVLKYKGENSSISVGDDQLFVNGFTYPYRVVGMTIEEDRIFVEVEVIDFTKFK